jgi:PAS domain S-box-containing protein
MNQHSDNQDDKNLRDGIIGLGSLSHQKSYYPELKQKIADLERFRTLLDETADAIFLVCVSSGICIDVNRAATTLTGYTTEVLLRKDIRYLLTSDSRDYFVEITHSNNKTGAPFAIRSEVSILTADNQEIPVEITVREVTLTDESYYVVVARDISDRKKTESELEQYRLHLEEMVAERNEELIVANQELLYEVRSRIKAEENLEEEKERLEITLKSIGDAVITTDILGTITYVNNAAEKMLGYRIFTGETKKLSEILMISRDDKEIEPGNLIHQAIASGRTIIIDDVIGIFRHSIKKIIAIIISPIVQSSRISGAVIVIRDITERIRLTEEIQKHERLESLGVLAGGIAHDFNNILTAILANISLSIELLEEDAPAAERMREAERATFRAKGLTQQLLTFSKGGAPIRECSQIENLIKETAGFAASGSNVQLMYDFSDSPALVDIDKGQISQVIQNLVLNAQQAMPDGGRIIITAHNAVVGMDHIQGLSLGKYVRITVTDEGQGIPHNAIPHIFEPYFSTKETGNGLGLTSSMFILKKHQGTIEVTSEPGMGTTFILWLPACKESDHVASETVDIKPIERAGYALLMDDEESILTVVSTLLKRSGWEVTCAHNGDEAVRAYADAMKEGRPYDVVIMDLVIPGGMGGKEAIRAIKDIDPDVFAIVSSGYSNDPVMADPTQYGFSRVLPKPYKIKDLLAIIHH